MKRFGNTQSNALVVAATTQVNVVPKWRNKGFFSVTPPSLRQEKDVKRLTFQFQNKIQPTIIITNALYIFCNGMHGNEFIIPDDLSKYCIITIVGVLFG